MHVIDVGMGGNQVAAIGQQKIHLPDHLDNFAHRVFVADVNQQPFGPVKNEVDGTPQPASGLVVHFDDVRKDFLAR